MHVVGSSIGFCFIPLRFVTCGGFLLGVMVTPWAIAQDENKADAALERTLSGVGEIELLKKGLATEDTGTTQDFVPTVSGETQILPGKLHVNPGTEDSQEEQAKQWKSQNWLLAGMQALESDEEDSGSAAGDPTAARPGATELWLEAAMAVHDESTTRATRSAKQEKGVQQDEPEVANPLNDFMADWLSTEDLARHALQNKPGIAGESFSRDVGGAARFPTEANIHRAARNAAPQQWERSTVEPPPNPFLGGLVGPTALLPATEHLTALPDRDSRPTLAPPTVEPPPMTRSPSPSPAAEPPRTPWKPPPDTDEKYFPRLKRF